MKFTVNQFTHFYELVNMLSSHDQMDRINARIDMPQFIKSTGRDKCDFMFEMINSGIKPEDLEEDYNDEI